MSRLFNGTTDKAVYGAAVATVWPLTFSAWIFPTSAASSVISGIDNSAAVAQLNYLGMTATPNAQCISRDNSGVAGGQSTAIGTVALGLNQWTHVAGTIASGGMATIYTAGGDKQSGANHSTFMGTVNNTTIGFLRRTSDSGFFPGRVAEACFWSVVLTDAEIAALATGRHCKSVRPKSIIGYWPLYGLVSPEPDLSGLTQSMTLTGTAQATHSPTSLFTPRHPEIIITGAVASHPRSQAYVYG